ncbi:MAG: hypothetical protein NZ990_03430, partial [Myxococcota bacterium]|nr:hypothetical protein [Myxococcota bacterium]
MAINKRKVLETARRHVQKGARAKAFKEYGRLLAADPQDAKLLLEVGDTYRRWGEVEEAIAHYTKVAALHRGEGYDARAIAVLKQIIKLDPMRHTVRVALAELYQQIGLAAEAVASLQQVADVYATEGRQRESLELLRKMAAVDPANTKGRVRVAEILVQAGQATEAVEEYREAASELGRRGETRSVVEIHERILAISPKHVSTLVAAARELCALGEPARAEPYAIRALDIEAKAEHYELACEIYAAMGNEDRLSEMTRDLAALYRERGDEERAREVMQRAPMGTELGGDLEGDLDGGASEGHDGFADFEVEPPDPSETVSTESGSEADRASSVLEQADVHLNYGQFDEAIACLEDLLAQSPRDRQALDKLGAAKVGVGDSDGASKCWQRAEAAAREEGDETAAEEFRTRVESLADPKAAAVEFDESFEIEIGAETDEELELEIGQDAGAQGFEFGDTGQDALSDATSGPSGAASAEAVDVEDVFESDPGPVAPRAAEPGEADTARIDEDLEEAEFYLQQAMVDEAAAIYRRILERVPGHAVAEARLAKIHGTGEETQAGEGASQGAAMMELEFDLEQDSDLELETDYETELEMDFQVDTGSRASVPTEEATAAPAPFEEADDGIEIEIDLDDFGDDESAALPDVAGELDGLQVAPAPGTDAASVEEGVAELFVDFKQGVSETLDEGDYQTRFDLGIAYREMELLDDAVAEFRYCLESPDWRLQSLQMIGLSSLDLGRPADAVSHFEQALSAPDLSDNQKAGLYFDFGRAQAAMGESDAAHNSFDR